MRNEVSKSIWLRCRLPKTETGPPGRKKKKVFCSSVSNEHTHSMGEEGFFRILKEFFFLMISQAPSFRSEGTCLGEGPGPGLRPNLSLDRHPPLPLAGPHSALQAESFKTEEPHSCTETQL